MATQSVTRFLKPQEEFYFTALKELREGRKKTHWMWYVLPQLKGLGRSPTAIFYGLQDLAEAQDYYNHELLGARLIFTTGALLVQETSDPTALMGTPDDVKLWSSMTLFSLLPNQGTELFQLVLDKYFRGRKDPVTLELLGIKP